MKTSIKSTLAIALSLAYIVITAAYMTGCGAPLAGDSDTRQNAAQEVLNQQAVAQVPMPSITKFQEKRLMKTIYELRDREDLITYAYITSLEGRPVFLFKAVGFGLPYATQFSNPQKADYNSETGGGNFTIAQAEPNGLYMPSSAEGTWLMAIDPKTHEKHVVYIEPRVIVSPFKIPGAIGNPND